MAGFRHYILTRFNTGLYGPDVKLKVSPQEWMDHRMQLFTAVTLPSIAGQTCQDFTWLVLMDPQTPEHHVRTLEDMRYSNMKIIYPTPGQSAWRQAIAPGQYDLITTRLDNDDAFHRDVVGSIQEAWRSEPSRQAKPWIIAFPFGLIMDLADRRLWLMEYWVNNCPSFVQDSRDPGTIYQWDHSQIPREIPRHYIKDKPYWLQVVHSQNLANTIHSRNPCRVVHAQAPGRLEHLQYFSVDPAGLPPA